MRGGRAHVVRIVDEEYWRAMRDKTANLYVIEIPI
jgi:hypothetical protein